MTVQEISNFIQRLEADDSLSIRYQERRWQISHKADNMFSIRWEECQFGIDGSLIYHQQTDILNRSQLIKILENFSYEDLTSFLANNGNSNKSTLTKESSLT